MHEDTEVKAVSVERPAPWALDRIDQPALPLNSEFDYYNLGTNVNIYVVDTVSHRESLLPVMRDTALTQPSSGPAA